MAHDPYQLVQKAHSIPSLPEIFYQLVAIIDDPNVSLSDISNVISEDTSLSARLLRIANSAMFNFPSRINTISQAITIIGTQQIRELVLATSVISIFKGISSDLVDMQSFWRHSIACGIAARAIATLRRAGNIEQFYVLGLLHDIGLLLSVTLIPDKAKIALTRCQQGGELLYRVEREVLGFNHGGLGAALLKAWRLPDAVQEPVGCHHSPTIASAYPEAAAIVHLAEIIVQGLSLGNSGEQWVSPLDQKAWRILALAEGSIATIVDILDQQYMEAVRLFLTDV
ncbi:HDOD domain-containing protein [Gammaproteobacteria bacterium]